MGWSYAAAALLSKETNGRSHRDVGELIAWEATRPDFDNFTLTYDQRCKIADIRARLDDAWAKIDDAKAAYAALLVEAREFAKVVLDRLDADYPKPAKSPRSEARKTMMKPWFEVSYDDPGEHEHWLAQLPVSVADGRVETVADTPNPPGRPLRLV